jgi:hypothetical protein
MDAFMRGSPIDGAEHLLSRYDDLVPPVERFRHNGLEKR